MCSGVSNLSDGQSGVQSLRASSCTVHDGVASVQTHLVVKGSLALLSELVTGVGDPAVALHEDSGSEVLAGVPPVGGARSRAACTENALVHSIELLTVRNGLEVLLHGGRSILALEVGLDGLVLLVELGKVGNEVLDDVGVGERVDLGDLAGVTVDTAWFHNQPVLSNLKRLLDIHKQARVLVPSMFMAQLPQIPSLQLRRKVKVGSTSFFMRIKASKNIGPVWLRSSSYSCMYGFFSGSSGFHL
jgi:hypothetical protein